MAAPRSPWIPLAALALLALIAGGAFVFFQGHAAPSAEPSPVVIPDDEGPEKPVTASRDPQGEPEEEPLDESLPPAQPSEAAARRALVAGLRARFSEPQLKAIARGSVTIEAGIRAQYGDSELAYEKMAEAWAKHCEKCGISEAERDALEDEAIRKGW